MNNEPYKALDGPATYTVEITEARAAKMCANINTWADATYGVGWVDSEGHP